MPHNFVKRNWVATAVVVALGVGTGLSIHNANQVAADRKAAQQDQITFNLGACERGYVLRTQVNANVEAIDTLRDATSAAVKLAASGGAPAETQARFAALGRKVDAIAPKPVDDPNCKLLVKAQTPGR